MAPLHFIPRALAFVAEGSEVLLTHDDLLDCSANLVVLGEAGMGKTRLLEELADGQTKFVTAQRLINSPDPRDLVGDYQCLLIDALDEASAYEQGEAVNSVLAQIEKSRVPRFILSCRVEDWQAATTVALIVETFGERPLELTLKPFDQEQIVAFMAEKLQGEENANAAIELYRARGLGDWLGNPQTLTMLADLIARGREPNSTTELFSDYVALSLPEANRSRRSRRADVGQEARQDILGAAFAALILSGKSALARPGADLSYEDLRLAELRNLPVEMNWDAVSGNRLIRQFQGDPDRLIYAHRRLGEWLAARWLAKQARSLEVRERLFAVLVTDGIVPASLRGVFGWLAGYPEFSRMAIATDPMAVIEYGDADILGERDGRALLAALEDVAAQDPYFAGWSESRAKALVKGNLLSSTLEVLRDRTRNDRLRTLLAGQLKGEKLAPEVVNELRGMALDQCEFYAIREEVAGALVGNVGADAMRTFIEQLRCQGSHDSTRLASHMILEAGIEHFDDRQIVDTIMADCGHTICAALNEGVDRMAAKAWRFRYEIPDDRIGSLLDILAEYAVTLLPEYRSIESSDIINLADALVARRLGLGSVEPRQLLFWLRAFGGRDSYVQDDKKAIFEFLREHAEVRQAIQQLWFEGVASQSDFFLAAHRLHETNRALAFDDDDLAALLTSLPADFPYWQEAVRIIRHDKTNGEKAREAARRFTDDDLEYDRFINALLNPEKPDWLIEREECAAKRNAERDQRWCDFRRRLEDERTELERGQFGPILSAARVYFGRFADLGELKTVDERLEALCGRDLIPSVRAGFEAFLNNLPPYPHAQTIATSYAESRYWHARWIMLAGLSERLRSIGSIEPLTQDQLVAAQLHCANQAPYGEEWKELRTAIWNAIVADPVAFERYARLLVEPFLESGNEFVTGLHELINQGMAAHPVLVVELVAEWLDRFREMHFRPESELMDVLIGQSKCALLKQLIESRLQMSRLQDDRRRNWQAAAVICDFDRASKELGQTIADEPELFWAIRERAGARRPYDDASEKFSTELAAWLVMQFRTHFPLALRPQGVTSGDTNPWDATEAISRLIDRVGADPSDQTEQLLIGLGKIDDSYRDRVLAVLAEHRRNRAERKRATLTVEALASILTGGPPQTIADLRARMLQLLKQVEAQARNSPTDSWVNFFRDDRKTPHDEERCRDRIIEMLQQHEHEIRFSPEKHLGDDREGDIACEIADLHLPIEVKGQWHDDLWQAADDQLAAQQACDHRAGGYGVLLVLWFGEHGKPLKGPPRASCIPKPTTPEELEVALTECSQTASRGQVIAKVIDLSRE